MWGVSSRPRVGEDRIGDAAHVALCGPEVVLATVDGLGHGREAARAAERAIEEVTRHLDEDVITLMRRCHEALQPTRGAVLSLVRIAPAAETLTWIGVGNVSGVVIRADKALDPPRENLLLRGGVVGYHLPALAATVLPVKAGDMVILATDGIDPAFATEQFPWLDPQQVAERLLQRFGNADDDALVLVGQYQGAA
jgi:hypothetical protein